MKKKNFQVLLAVLLVLFLSLFFVYFQQSNTSIAENSGETSIFMQEKLNKPTSNPYSDLVVEVKGTKLVLYTNFERSSQEVEYRDSSISYPLLFVSEQKITLVDGEKVAVVWLEKYPAGCPNITDEACLMHLAQIESEFSGYGGLWIWNLEKNSLRYLGKPTIMDGDNFRYHKTPILNIDPNFETISVNVTSILEQKDGSTEEHMGKYIVNLDTGEWK